MKPVHTLIIGALIGFSLGWLLHSVASEDTFEEALRKQTGMGSREATALFVANMQRENTLLATVSLACLHHIREGRIDHANSILASQVAPYIARLQASDGPRTDHDEKLLQNAKKEMELNPVLMDAVLDRTRDKAPGSTEPSP